GRLPSLHASFSDGRLAAGVSVGVPFGARVTWPADWAGRHEIISSRLLVVRTAPFVAWRHGALRVAGGVHLDAGELRLGRSLDFVDAEGDVELSLRGAGLGVHLAAFAEVARGERGALDLGLTYKSRTSLSLSGEADFTSPDAFSTRAADQPARSSLTLPDRITAGAAWSRGPLTALVDVELQAWQVHDEVAIDFERDQTPHLVQPSRWRATVAVRAGAEWQRGAWTARGGLFRDPTPSPAEHLAPSSPDATRIGGSLGLGRALGDALALDAFWSYLRLQERAAENPESIPARYRGSAHLLGVGLRYHR